MNVYLTRPMLRSIDAITTFTPHHIFECALNDLPMVIFPDVNILSHAPEIFSQAENNGMKAIKDTLHEGYRLVEKEGFKPPPVCIFPLTLYVEGKKDLTSRYTAGYRWLYEYLGFQTFKPLSEVIREIPETPKKIETLPETPVKTMLINIYVMTLLMLYCAKRFEYAKRETDIYANYGFLDVNIMAMPHLLYEMQTRLKVIDPVAVRLMLYFFSPGFTLNADPIKKIKNNFFKQLDKINSLQSLEKQAKNIAGDILLYRTPMLANIDGWVLTGDKGLAAATQFLPQFYQDGQGYFTLDIRDPVFDNEYWRVSASWLKWTVDVRAGLCFDHYDKERVQNALPALKRDIEHFFKTNDMSDYKALGFSPLR